VVEAPVMSTPDVVVVMSMAVMLGAGWWPALLDS
jgi:hypothetical protein